MLFVELGAAGARSGAVILLPADPTPVGVGESASVLEPFERLSLLAGAYSLAGIALSNGERIVGGQVRFLAAACRGSGWGWTPEGPFQLDKPPGEFSPRELGGAEMGARDEEDGANIFEEGVDHQIFVAFDVNISYLPLEPSDVGGHRFVVGLVQRAGELERIFRPNPDCVASLEGPAGGLPGWELCPLEPEGARWAA